MNRTVEFDTPEERAVIHELACMFASKHNRDLPRFVLASIFTVSRIPEDDNQRSDLIIKLCAAGVLVSPSETSYIIQQAVAKVDHQLAQETGPAADVHSTDKDGPSSATKKERQRMRQDDSQYILTSAIRKLHGSGDKYVDTPFPTKKLMAETGFSESKLSRIMGELFPGGRGKHRGRKGYEATCADPNKLARLRSTVANVAVVYDE